MNSGYYAATTALVAQTEALEVAANNLANVNSNGYRTQREYFRSVLAAQDQGLSPLNRAINNFGVLGGTLLDQHQGQLEATGNDFDLALEGAGFFAVKSGSHQQFTRNGNFHVDKSGQLVTADGAVVLGDNGPIQVPADGSASVSADGTISVNGAVAGRLKLVNFSPSTQLQPVGQGYYTAPASAASAAPDARVRQRMLEASNANPITATVSLIAIQRRAEMLQRTLAIFNNDFNRLAAEQLSKVAPGS